MSLNVVVTEREKGVFVITCAGPIDATTAMILEKEADKTLESGPKAIILDLGGVTYLSSAGLRVIFKMQKTLKQNQGVSYLVNIPAPVKKVFDIVNALPSEGVFESIEELDDYLDKMQRREKNS